MTFRERCGDRVFIEEMKKPTIDQVLYKIRTYAYAQEVKVVLVDYLQAITDPEVSNGNKVQEMSSIISKLKRCATECKVALITFSQLARDEYRDGTEPGLNSMKYCGDIENESELVVLMWRDADGSLHVKIPKVKWTKARGARFIVDVDDVTGCFGEWRDDLSAPTERETKGKKRGASAD
jgi:replicative DNA helicase